MLNNESAVSRIERYYHKISMNAGVDLYDSIALYSSKVNAVIDALLPYAKENNYWWENKDVKMAYYQLQTPIIVVDENDFKKYYHKLMGKKLNLEELQNEKSRAEIINEATIKYNKYLEKNSNKR